METAEVIFYEIEPVKAETIKNEFDAYVAPGIKMFFVDQSDHCVNDEQVSDFFLKLGFDEMQVNDLLFYRIWCFYYRD